jgi:hypothetical protein
MIPPSGDILTELSACVKRGDLLRIPDYLAHKNLERAEYRPFVERVHYLARTFQVDALEHFLHQYLQQSGTKSDTLG